jgi:tetratricopeptide (TPR) repeat protein
VTLAVVLASAVVAAVAAAGVLRPFGRGGTAALERLADPLEEERVSSLRSLRDLDDEWATGQLSDADFQALRREQQRRAVSVLRAIQARDGSGDMDGGLAELRDSRPAAESDEPDPGKSRTVVSVVLAGVLLAVAIPALAAAVTSRAPGAPITGDAQTSPLAFFEQRVRQHPGDLAARLDLAERYLQAGQAQDAIEQYLEALKIDPHNAEARATLGYVLFVAGKPDKGLEQVDQALADDPNYADGLYYRGVILLNGLHRPNDAADAFRAYLDAAPFGSRRAEVEGLLARATAG